MDDKKDTQKSEQAQYAQRTGAHPAPQSQGFAYIVKKAEKLTTALYMVTDVLSDKEPMKWRAREAGVELLSDLTVAGTQGNAERMSALREIMKKVERTVSFLDVSASARMITEMNASVLKKEYLHLKDSMESEWERIHDRSRAVLTERFFDVPREPERALPAKAVSVVGEPPRVDQKVQVREPEVTPVPPRITPQTLPHVRVPDAPVQARPVFRAPDVPIVATSFTERVATPRPTPQLRDVPPTRPDFGKDDRRKIILALLKQKPSVNVGDIARSIPGVSEKTIQRELLAMVAEGVLEKRGERRWSTYSLRAT